MRSFNRSMAGVSWLFLGSLSVACGPAETGDASVEPTASSSDELELNTTYWAQFGRTARRTFFNPFETAIGPANVATLGIAWSCCEGQSTSMVLSHGRLFTEAVVISTGVTMTMRSLDPATGTANWVRSLVGNDSTFDTDEGPGLNITVGYGRVHTHQFGYSYIFSTSTGEPVPGHGVGPGLQARFLGTNSESWPLLKAHRLVYAAADTISAADSETDQVLWRSSPHAAARDGALALANGKVFSVTDDGRLTALDAETGSTVWTSAVAGGTIGAPSVYLGHVLAVRRPATVQAYDERTGVLLWQSPLDAEARDRETDRVLAESAPAVNERAVYATLQAATGIAVAAFDLTTGVKIWERLLAEDGSLFQIRVSKAVANGVLYVGSKGGNLYALDALKGDVLATFALGSPVDNIIVGDGRVHVALELHGVRTLSLRGE